MGITIGQIQKGTLKTGAPWIRGEVSIGKKNIFLDTRTGEGVNDILNSLKKFIIYQSNKIKFPAMNQEDVMQELYLLAVEAIPKYTDDKNANMLTFLQGHIKNRLINKCKYVSEKKRRATYVNLPSYKVRCPQCRSFMITDEEGHAECSKCGTNTHGGEKWKRYNIPILPIPFSAIEHRLPDDATTISDLLPSNQTFATLAGKTHYAVDEEVQFRLDFRKVYDSLDDTNKRIVSMLLEGYAYRDIANKVGISEKATYARVAKILQSSKSQ